MKKVMNPKTKEILIIDESKEKDWMDIYWHQSGVPFEKPIPKTIKNPEKIKEIEDKRTLSVLTKKYKARYNKEIPVNKKSDIEWIRRQVEKK